SMCGHPTGRIWLSGCWMRWVSTGTLDVPHSPADRFDMALDPLSNLHPAHGPVADSLEHHAGFLTFDRAHWAALRAPTPLSLSDADLATLRGLNDSISLEEVADIHLPLTRLLNLHITAARSLATVKDAFLGTPADTPPYIIGIAGSVAVGKS